MSDEKVAEDQKQKNLTESRAIIIGSMITAIASIAVAVISRQQTQQVVDSAATNQEIAQSTGTVLANNVTQIFTTQISLEETINAPTITPLSTNTLQPPTPSPIPTATVPPTPTPFSIQVNAEQVGEDTNNLFKVVLTHIDILPNDKSRWYFDFVNNSQTDYCLYIEKDYSYVTDTDTQTAYDILGTSLPTTALTVRALSKESFTFDFKNPVVSGARNFAVRLTTNRYQCAMNFKIFEINLSY